MKPIVGALAAVLTLLPWCATTAVGDRGFRVVDAQGSPVAEARVAVVGRPGSVRTDASGVFRLDPSLRPPLELAVFDHRGTFLGIVALDEEAWNSGEPLRLGPEPAAEITVRAGLAPATPAPPAAAATLITRDDREREQPERLMDLIESTPGVGRTEEGQTGVPSVRGLARGRTLVLLDGNRITAERRAGPSATFLDPFSLESVEVVRGPGSVAYGSDAIGGIIHAQTSRPRLGERGGRWEVGAGAGVPFLGGGVAWNLPVGSGGLLLEGRGRWFEDYRAPGGAVKPSGVEDRGGAVRGVFPLSGGTLDFGARVETGRDVGKPSVATTTASYPREDSRRFQASFAFDPVGGLDGLEVGAFAGRYRLVTRRDRPASGTTLRLVQVSDVEADDGALRASAFRGLGEGLLRFGVDASGRFSLNAEGSFDSLDENGGVVTRLEETSVEDASRFSVGAFVEVEHPIRSWAEWSAGARYDRIRTRNRGGYFGDRSTSQSTPTGYVAATFRQGSARSATLQVARGFRDPSLSDRYFRGVTGRGFATGNPDLEPETSLQWDLTLRTAIPRGHAALSAYRYRIFDLVERYREGDDFFFRNRGEERLWGIEFEVDAAPAPRWTLRGGASYTRGRIADDRSPAGDIPPPKATLSLGRVHDRFDWEVRATGVLRKDDPGPTEAATPGVVVLGASLRVPLPARTEVRLRLDNLLDRAYPGSPDAEAAAAPGRSASLVFSGAF